MVELAQDQAAGLRSARARRPVKVIAVTGGKGGVGKSVVSVNLGTALAQLGRRVMLLDADLGLANVDLLLGMRARFNLEHVLAGECELEDVILSAPSGLQIVPASSGNAAMANLDNRTQAGIIDAFGRLLQPAEVLLVDTAAGINPSVLTFAGAAQRVVVVVCDEPASLADAYGLIKVMCRQQAGCRIEIVTNLTDTLAQGRELYQKLARVVHRFLGVNIRLLGSIPSDAYLRQAVQRQSSVVEAFPGSESSRAFKALARAVDSWAPPATARGGIEFFVERLAGFSSASSLDAMQ